VGWSIAAAAAAAALLLPFLLPYWQLYHEQGLTRSIEEAARFSAVWRQYLSTPSRLHYRWWSYRWFAGSALFPGVVALALTSVAIGSGVAFRDRRARMCLMIGIAGIVLSFGTKVPGFSMLYEHVPLLHSVRVVSRFGFLAIFAAASLAAFGAAHLASLLPSRMRGRAGVAVVVLAAIELFPGPLELVRFEGIPRIYASLRDAHDAIVVEMPFYGGATAFVQARYMLNSTAHWRPILNGYTGLPVRSYERNIARLASFPDASSVAWLQAQAVTHVFVHTDELDAGRSAALDAMPQLHRVASEGPLVLFRLDPARMSASQ
jgi:hypothetical protein